MGGHRSVGDGIVSGTRWDRIWVGWLVMGWDGTG